jgi:hypothetical protein
MAEKKTAAATNQVEQKEPVQTTEQVELKEPVQTPEQPVDEWKIMKEITLPRARTGEARSVPCWVNGKGYQVPRGKPVEVPAPIYDVLQGMLAAELKEEEMREQIPNEG